MSHVQIFPLRLRDRSASSRLSVGLQTCTEAAFFLPKASAVISRRLTFLDEGMDEATSLFKFRAGKSRLDGKLLVADTRKGMVEVLRVRLRYLHNSYVGMHVARW